MYRIAWNSTMETTVGEDLNEAIKFADAMCDMTECTMYILDVTDKGTAMVMHRQWHHTKTNPWAKKYLDEIGEPDRYDQVIPFGTQGELGWFEPWMPRERAEQYPVAVRPQWPRLPHAVSEEGYNFHRYVDRHENGNRICTPIPKESEA